MNTFPGADERVAHLDIPPTLAVTPWLDQWIRFDPQGKVQVFSGKVELGQGIASAIAQIAAEELDVSYECIEVVPMDTDFSPNEGSTSGSRSIQEGGEAMRQACAEVRAVLVAHAAQQFEVSPDDVVIENGTMKVVGTDRILSMFALACEIEWHRLAQGVARPKSSQQHRLIGQALPRKDLPVKLMGQGFLHDMKLPGMLHARILRPPGVQARLKSCNLGPTLSLPGVIQAWQDGSWVAVVAQREEQAIRAWKQLAKDTEWHVPACLPAMHGLSEFLTHARHEQEVLVDTLSAQHHAPLSHRARFTRPYLSHGSIGPSCAIAWQTPQRMEVWTHSQSLHALRNEMAKLMGLRQDQVVVRFAQGAGCYGHNGADDVAFDAALIAQRLPGAPIRVQWMREDEFAWEPQGPAMVVDLQAELDDQGQVCAWSESIWGNRHIGRPGRRPEPGLLAAWHMGEGCEMMPPADMALALGGGSQRNAVPYYEFAAMKVVNHAVTEVPIRVSALRALGAYLNVFAIESFMDELASRAQVDPVTFRLNHLSDPRSRAVIEKAAQLAHDRWGWDPKAAGNGQSGTGMGFARYKNVGCHAAVVLQVEVTDTVQVKRALAVVDCGQIVNPDGVRHQIEGGLIQVISWALKEQVSFDERRITSTDWEQYPILRFSETPEIEVVLMAQPHEPWLGVGEGVTGPAAAALANALHHAMGVRVRDLPLTPERIVQAMS